MPPQRGGRSSVGRAPVCGTGCRGFDPRRSPHFPLVAALILAGGRASRLGGLDKPLLMLDGGTLLDSVLRRVRPQVGPVALSANGDPARFARFGLPVLADPRAGLGPLGGLLAGLRWAAASGETALLTVPGDTPFIPEDLASRLAPPPSVAAGEGGVHHLVACWDVGCAAALEAYLTGGGRRVSAFGETCGARRVVFAGAPDPFFNVNTPADLAWARATVRGVG